MNASPAVTLSPDLIVHSGRVLNTVDQDKQVRFTESEAFAVSNGRVIAVGPDAQISQYRGEHTELVDLAGRTVLPGFIETHMHIGHYGENLLQVDCRPAMTSSVASIKSAISAAVERARPGEWVFGWGWDESRMEHAEAPDRWDLDEVAPRNPVKLTRTCGHMALFNSNALSIAAIDESTDDPEGGHLVRDEASRLTGLLQERALELVATPAQSPETLRKGLTFAQHELLARGITTVHDMSTQADELRALTDLSAENPLLRLRPWLWAIDSNGHRGLLRSAIGAGLKSGFGNDQLRIQGVKFMLDGSVGGRTAALEQPYVDSDDSGILIRETDEVSGLVAAAIDNGLRVAIHGIGERAIDVAIGSIDSLKLSDDQIARLRNRIEHCGLPTRANLQRMKELGLIAASSISFLYELGDSYLTNLGRQRVARAYPHRSFREYGILAPPNSDCPVTDPNPWNVIYAATKRSTSTGRHLGNEEALTLAEAVHSYTAEAAYTSFEEGELGSLHAGAHADFVILDRDPRDSESVLEINADATYVAGRRVYSSS